MSVLDQFGQSISSRKLIRSSAHHVNGVEWQPTLARDFDDLFTQSDWRSTLTQSRLVFANFAVPRAAMLQKAGWTSGTGWSLEYTGQDEDWGREATEKLQEWLDHADISGRGNFNLSIKSDSLAVDRDGDFFLMLIKDENDHPAIQRVPGHRIATRDPEKDLVGSDWAGATLTSGVVTNDWGRIVAYHVIGEKQDGTDDRVVPSAHMIQILDEEWQDQTRGIPAFAPVINELRKSKTSEDWELLAQLVNSSISLVEYNDTGTADPNAAENYGAEPAVPEKDGITSQEINGGAIRYFRANSGNKLESISSSRPSDMWDRFQDRVDRKSCSAIDWPYELAGKIEGLNGVSIRNVQERARAAVSYRQRVLKDAYLRVVRWGLASLIEAGVIPNPSAPADAKAFDFIMPPQLSIDPRHDSKTALEEWRAGSLNMTQILRSKGRTVESHYRQRCEDIATRKRVKEECEVKHGIEIDEREMIMFTPNDMADTEPTEPTTTTDE